jgi:hypothetical protein
MMLTTRKRGWKMIRRVSGRQQFGLWLLVAIVIAVFLVERW